MTISYLPVARHHSGSMLLLELVSSCSAKTLCGDKDFMVS